MSAVEDRLAELGLTVPEVAKPVAAYVPAVRDGNLVFTSGQLPMVSGALAQTGKVGTSGGDVSPDSRWRPGARVGRRAWVSRLAALFRIVGSARLRR